MLRDAVIETKTTTKKHQIGEDAAIKAALIIIGHRFTKHFVAQHGNEQIKGFQASAERCRDQVKTWNKRMTASAILFIAAIAMFIGAILMDNILKGIALGLPAAVVLLIGVVVYKNTTAVGKTARTIALEWKLERSKVLTHLVGDLSVSIQYSDDANIYYDVTSGSPERNKHALDRLAWHIENRLNTYATDVKTAEREGLSKKKPRGAFGDVHHLGRVLGYEMKSWEYYLGKS